MKIVFMGTPEFAVASLQRLHQSRHQVTGIVTTMDKPRGRGQKLSYSAVKQYALEHQLAPILQPSSLISPDFIQHLSTLQADLFVVVAFRILPEAVFSIPAQGTINLHASLLPQYRGAAPINWAIINGEKETGVTTFLLNKGVDTGKILLQEKAHIQPDETAGNLHDRLMKTGASLLLDTVNGLEKRILIPKIQSEGEFKKAPKIDQKIMNIHWELDAQEVKQQIHGLSPYPAAFTFYSDKKIKIYLAKTIEENNPVIHAPGTISISDKRTLAVQTGKGQVQILELQFPGKKRISVEEAQKGYRFSVGERFTKEG